MSGYTGKILWVSLGDGCLQDRPLEYTGDYIGGSGIGAKILWELLGESFGSIDPLSAENPLILMTGPLVGSGLPCTGRLAACSKSPLTGIYAESSVGGFLGAALKFSGYDGIVFTGKAAKPCFLSITDQGVALQDAGHLWGRDTYDTCDELLSAVAGAKGLKAAACIGPAGENLLPFANIAHNKGHFLGRAGLGAVMGSKKLKGLAIAGQIAPALHDPAAVSGLKKQVISNMKENIVLETLKAYGTNGALDIALFTGDVPIKNWSLGEWEEGISKINGPSFETVLTGRKTCYACPVTCKREVEVPSGPFATPRGPGPEYETVASFGTMCLIDSVEALCKINELCNRLGMDTITAGASLAFFLEASEKGLLPPDLSDPEYTFGNAAAALKLIMDMGDPAAKGKIFARASTGLAEAFGASTLESLTTVKGLEAPMHDPRAGHGMGLAYATGYRGACHMSDLTMSLEQGSTSYPDLGLEDFYEAQSSEGKAKMVALSQDLGGIVGGAAIFCLLGHVGYSGEDMLAALRSVTGKDFTMDDLLLAGRRIWYLKRALGNLCGVTASDDVLPPRLTEPLAEGSAAGSVPDITLMLDEYYQIRQLTTDGKPTKEVLLELGLGDLIPALYK